LLQPKAAAVTADVMTTPENGNRPVAADGSALRTK